MLVPAPDSPAMENVPLAITWLDAEMSPVPVSVSVPAVIVVAPL